jgi:HlyD family secretion protein
MLTIKNFIKYGLLILAVAALVYSFIPEPVIVDAHQVESGSLVLHVDGEGKTRIHDIYVVSAPIDGRVTRIESEPGDRVVAGTTVVANMYPSNPQLLDKRTEVQAQADVDGARAALGLASARVKQAEAQLAFDRAEYKRISELYKKGSISQSALERAQLQIDTLEAELETANSNLEVTQSRLKAAEARLLQPSIDGNNDNQNRCQICIYSPVDGTVLRILHKSESIIPVGTPLVEIGNPNELEVVIELLSTDAVKVAAGDRAIISRWGGEPINARVRLIEPSGFTKISALGVEEQRVYVILNFTDPVEQWSSLGNAFRVEASIIIDELETMPLVPLTALFRYEQQWSVYQIIDGVLIRQAVEVAGRNDRYAAISRGLREGDIILSYTAKEYYDGMSVSY